jgi:ferric-dicitrate binding protein FerR (iron transport regulator)
VNPQRDTKYALTNLTYFKSNDTTIVETSWVGNKLVFKDENFGELANQMERWYGVKIKFKNDNLKDYHFTGIFEKESVLQAMSALQMIEPFHYKVKNESVYIY